METFAVREIDSSEPQTSLEFLGSMTIHFSEDIHRLVLPYTTPSRDLTIDMATVTDVDTCGVQAMIALEKQLTKANHTVRYVNVDTSIVTKMKLLGATDHLSSLASD